MYFILMYVLLILCFVVSVCCIVFLKRREEARQRLPPMADAENAPLPPIAHAEVV